MHHNYTFKAPKYTIVLHHLGFTFNVTCSFGYANLVEQIPTSIQRFHRYKNLVGNWSTDHALKMQTPWRIDSDGEVKSYPNPHEFYLGAIVM